MPIKIAFFSFIFLAVTGVLPLHASDAKEANHTATDSTRKVFEEGFVTINGIKQWITIKGDRSKPAILFLHGGPGSPISPYAHNLYADWEKDFIIVQWDQRGTGKTYGLTAPEELTPAYLKDHPLTLAQMTADGIAVSEYLVKHLSKGKIILFGTSWGSALGVSMAAARPDLYHAYVGHSQIVSPANDLPLYNKVYSIAVEKKDSEALAILNALGKPPYAKARNVGKLLRVTKQYEGERSDPPPDQWFVEGPLYTTPKDRQHRADGDDYSFVNYIGDTGLGVGSMRSGINFLRDHTTFKIPIHFIQGEEDLLTPKELSQAYFEKLTAPDKSYILLPNTAHGFNEAVLGAQYKLFKSIKVD
jgi:pimeloyl-ACP methyl ester carboxylesterase